MLNITATVERFPIRGGFTIARGSKSVAETVVCRVSDGSIVGHGEAVPYARYGETVEAVLDRVASSRSADRDSIASMEPGAARNALDCAMWDFEAKRSGHRAHLSVCNTPPRPLNTAFTVSLGSVTEMADAARAASGHKLLKVKVGADDGHDAARIHAVSTAAPDSRIILDANEGWTPQTFGPLMMEAARSGVVLIEQPLPVGEDDALRGVPHPVPICADESAHVAADLAALTDRYDVVNIKLDKAGGLTEALAMRREARRLGFGVMVGCMVGSSLAMAPAVLLAQEADYADLDGPLLLARDREPGLRYSGSVVSPPTPELWG